MHTADRMYRQMRHMLTANEKINFILLLVVTIEGTQQKIIRVPLAEISKQIT